MALIGSDFTKQKHVGRTRRCSECGKKISAGDDELVSIRFGKLQKRVCSEACRLQFDHDYWQEAARLRQKEVR